MRKLATVRRINNIRPIEGADAIVCALIDGWTVIIKKDEYKINDLAIYCEIDSWIPTTIAPFLSKGLPPKKYMDIEGERLKTCRFRGQLSQGLLLPLDLLSNAKEGDDVTELLGIIKWEVAQPAQLFGDAKGSFPSDIPKTDQERIQNLKELYDEYKNNYKFEITEKLDGSSCTFYLDRNGDFKVCSRNLSLWYNDTNSYWQIAIKYDIRSKMINNNLFGYSIQGELIGENIQKNPYNIKGIDFYVFDIYDVKIKRYLTSVERINITKLLGLKHCSILENNFVIPFTISEFLDYSEGKSNLYSKAEREGIVVKAVDKPHISFKVISNKFLLKTG